MSCRVMHVSFVVINNEYGSALEVFSVELVASSVQCEPVARCKMLAIFTSAAIYFRGTLL